MMGTEIRTVGVFGEETVVTGSWYKKVHDVIYRIQLGATMTFNPKVPNELIHP